MTGLTGDRRAIFFCIGSCSLNVAGLTGGLFLGTGSCGLNVTGLIGGLIFLA